MCLEEVDGRLDKDLPGHSSGSHVRIFGGSFVPSTNGDKRLQSGILALETNEASHGALSPVVVKIVPCVENPDLVIVAESDETVDDLRAQRRVDVLDIEFSGTGTVDSPGAVIANHFFARCVEHTPWVRLITNS